MGCDAFLEGSRVDLLCTQLYYIWFDRVSDGCRWYTFKWVSLV